jgi:hypothetical protein
MLNFEQAKKVALIKLEDIEKSSNVKLSLLESETIAFDYGWVFFYQSDEFVKTGNTSKLVGGNAPIIVDKYDGSIILTGTSKSTKYYIEVYSRFKKDWLG